MSRGTVTDRPLATDVATQTAGEEPPRSTPAQPAPSAAVTADAECQCMGPEVSSPDLPTRPPMSTVELIGMARPYWFLPIDEAAPRVASAVLEMFLTPLTHSNLVTNLSWAHAGKRDLVQYLLHRLSDQGRAGLSADQIMNSLWWFLTQMQR